MAEGFSANGQASFRHVFGMGSAGKECDLGRERNSLHWSGGSSPIGRCVAGEEKGELAERKNIVSRERFNSFPLYWNSSSPNDTIALGGPRASQFFSDFRLATALQLYSVSPLVGSAGKSTITKSQPLRSYSRRRV
ncbi:hypothetical protein TNCV_2026081 [Trichonephila clavipes]|nr:hypothetical protein TNCV_2026081 [Trichonephila clavipes]